MRKLLCSLALVCALTSAVFAGVIHQPGDDPDCALTATCSDAASGSFVAVIVDGVLFIYSLLP